MANISTFLGKAMLDWAFLGATPTRPGQVYLSIGGSSPNSTNGSEYATGSGITRKTIAFSAAGSPGNTAGNSIAATFGPISALTTVFAWHVWDTSAATAGHMLWVGTLTTQRTCSAGDTLVFAIGALEIGLH